MNEWNKSNQFSCLKCCHEVKAAENVFVFIAIYIPTWRSELYYTFLGFWVARRQNNPMKNVFSPFSFGFVWIFLRSKIYQIRTQTHTHRLTNSIRKQNIFIHTHSHTVTSSICSFYLIYMYSIHYTHD